MLRRPNETENTARSSHIIYRPLKEGDEDHLRQLHEEWFPIKYNQNFYDNAVRGYWLESKETLFTQAAALQRNVDQTLTEGDPVLSPRLNRDKLLGAVTAQIHRQDSTGHQNLLADSDTYTHVMYLLTLGSNQSYRRQGIATTLVRSCVEKAQTYPNVGAVYLHVKADNEVGMQFYEKNGFTKLRYLDEYYVINGRYHGAYIYIMYIHNATAPPSWVDRLIRPFIAFFSFAYDLFSPISATGGDSGVHHHILKKTSPIVHVNDNNPVDIVV